MNKQVTRAIIRTLQTLAMPVIIIALFAFVTGGRSFTQRTMLVNLQQSVIPIIISLALVANMKMGLLDFSAGAVVMAAAIFGGNLAVSTGTGVPGLVLFCTLTSIVLASITGFLNNKVRVPLIVLTLGLMLVYEALPRVFFPNGAKLLIEYITLALTPWIFIVFTVVFTVFYILYNFTTYGHNIRAMGGNEDIARTAGLNLSRIKQVSFTISGLFLGMAAVLTMSSQGQIFNVASFSSMGIMFSAFMGVILAFFLTSYCNLAIGVVVGTFTMTALSNGLVTAGISQNLRDVLTGVLLLLLLVFSANQGRFKQWQIDRERVRLLNAKKVKAAFTEDNERYQTKT